MKKASLTLFLVLSALFSAGAQSAWRRNFELEAGASLIACYKPEGASTKVPAGFSAELRYNAERLPLDFGIGFGMGTLKREWKGDGRRAEYAFRNVLAAADWNFRRHARFSPFVGLSAGYSFRTTRLVRDDLTEGGASDYSRRNNAFCFAPRIGFEICGIVRLSAGYKFMGDDYSHLDFTLGVVFGGWKRAAGNR